MVELKRTDLAVQAERAVLAQVYPGRQQAFAEASLAELRSLATTARAKIVGELTQARDRADAGTYVGKGKLTELARLSRRVKADLVICDDDLKPAQVKNLESALDLKVIDRSELILDIFATHARTRQAKLQVELAQLEYAFPRLKRMWSHLDRTAGGTIAGGIGVRGPGEKQLEVDRRLVQKRIQDLTRELEKIQRRRERMVRQRADRFTTLTLVGYTNVGKSTLMNALTGAGVPVRDRLFETLDTRTRQWNLPDGRQVLLSDTVGFIRKLPHHLVTCFHATLEEALGADLLLHVVDASSPWAEAQIDAVEEVLREIGCSGQKVLVVLNKIDQLADRLRLPPLLKKAGEAVCVSAVTGEGLQQLAERIQEFLDRGQVELIVEAAAGNGKLLALLYENGVVLDRAYGSATATVRARVPADLVGVIRSLGGRISESRPARTGP